MSAADILKQDPYYLAERIRVLQPYLDLFAKQLAQIYTIMPAPKRILDLKTGEWGIINDEKWENFIEDIKAQQEAFLQSSFPEFYQTK